MPVNWGSGSFQARRASARWPSMHPTGKVAEILPDRVSLSPPGDGIATGPLGKPRMFKRMGPWSRRLKPTEEYFKRKPVQSRPTRVGCEVCGLDPDNLVSGRCPRHLPQYPAYTMPDGRTVQAGKPRCQPKD